MRSGVKKKGLRPGLLSCSTERSMTSEQSPVSGSPSNRFVIIMAGGRGERFWPVSREKTPKQLITLLGGRSFLQQAVDRVAALVPAENILVITNKVQAPTVRKQLPQLPTENVVAEPVGRDTCAAVALGAALVGARNPNGVMAVLPADHVIPEPEKFQQVLADALDVASRGQTIVTIGIQPNEPATGYGYIRSGAALPASEGAEPYKTAFFVAEQFVEKPPLEKAIEYLAAGNYRWNAGMFVWSYATILAGMKEHQPDMADAIERWLAAAVKGPEKLASILKKQYPEIRKISIDFALMEKARNVVVADGAFAWDDLGAWPALARHIIADANGNSSVGTVVQVDSERNVVYDARTKKQTPITLVGIKDAIIVLADDATLVASKNEAQKIKDLVKKLGADPALKKLV